MPRDLLSEYPKDENGEPIDTPDWRNADNIKDCAHEKDAKIITAIRQYDVDPALLDACLEASEDINTTDRFGFTPLMLAIKSKQENLVDVILKVDGVLVDIQTKRGFTALMIAAWKSQNEIVQKLVSKGATLNLKDGSGRNAWGVAHDWHNEETLELLDRNGLNYKSMGGTATAFPPAPKWRQDEQW